MSVKYKNHELKNKLFEIVLDIVLDNDTLGNHRCVIHNITDNLYYRSSDTFDDANVKKVISRWVYSSDSAWYFRNTQEASDFLENELEVQLNNNQFTNKETKEHDPLDRFKALEI